MTALPETPAFVVDVEALRRNAAILREVAEAADVHVLLALKAFSMPGWRVGYTLAHEDLIKQSSKLQGQMTSHMCSIAQKAGVAALDALDPAAPKIAERSVRELGMRGISIEPGWCSEPCYCDDPRLDPVYETAESLGVFVMITMSYLLGPDLSYSDPLRLEHVVSRYRNTPFLIPHACWPHFISMAAVSFKYPNLYWVPDFFFYLPFMPSVDVMPAFNTALKKQVLFASSYPVRGLEEAVRRWKEKAWEPEALELSLSGNAARLLNLKP